MYMYFDQRATTFNVLLIVASSVYYISRGFFDRIFFCTWSMCPLDVDTLFGRHFLTSCTMSPIH